MDLDEERAYVYRQARLAEHLGSASVLLASVAVGGGPFVIGAMSIATGGKSEWVRVIGVAGAALSFVAVQGLSGTGVVLAYASYQRLQRLGESPRRAKIAGGLSLLVFVMVGLSFLLGLTPLVWWIW